MQLSTLIGKKIFTQKGEAVGYVKNIYLNKNKKSISTVECVDKEEEEFYLPQSAILSAEEFIIAGGARKKQRSGIPIPLGKPVFNEKGALLGRVSELNLEEDGATLTVQKEDEEKNLPCDGVSFGDVLIYHEKKRQVPIMETVVCDAPCPRDTLYSFDLLGKRAKRAVENFSGERLVSVGEIITPSIIKSASKHNLLLELTTSAFME